MITFKEACFWADSIKDFPVVAHGYEGSENGHTADDRSKHKLTAKELLLYRASENACSVEIIARQELCFSCDYPHAKIYTQCIQVIESGLQNRISFVYFVKEGIIQSHRPILLMQSQKENPEYRAFVVRLGLDANAKGS